MAEEELPLLPINDKVIETDKTTYQRKIGSILYVAIFTRPDIIFAAARLSRHNCHLGRIYQEVIDRVIRYLYKTRFRCIRYGYELEATFYVCMSDASFADNTLD